MRIGKCLKSFDRRLSSCSAVCWASVILDHLSVLSLQTASWIEELHLNDNAFGSAPPRMGRAIQSSSNNSDADSSAPAPSTPAASFSPSSSGSPADPTQSSTAAAQLLGVSLTCMKNLRVLDLNRCRLCKLSKYLPYSPLTRG